jgi:hypothetical protein
MTIQFAISCVRFLALAQQGKIECFQTPPPLAFLFTSAITAMSRAGHTPPHIRTLIKIFS